MVFALALLFSARPCGGGSIVSCCLWYLIIWNRVLDISLLRLGFPSDPSELDRFGFMSAKLYALCVPELEFYMEASPHYC